MSGSPTDLKEASGLVKLTRYNQPEKYTQFIRLLLLLLVTKIWLGETVAWENSAKCTLTNVILILFHLLILIIIVFIIIITIAMMMMTKESIGLGVN